MTHQPFPRIFLTAIVFFCIIPIVLNALGLDFTSRPHEFLESQLSALGSDQSENQRKIIHLLAGGSQHVLLEWSSLTAISLTIILAFAHFANSRDITVAIFGVAFLFLGIMEAFHTLAAMRLLGASVDYYNLMPFTWALARGFSAITLIIGVMVCLQRRSLNARTSTRMIIGLGAVFGVVTYFLISYTMGTEKIPRTQYPNALITRPFDAIPLVLYLMSIPLFLKLYRRSHTTVAAAFLIILVPQIMLEAHMAFGSAELFDNHFNIAHYQKVIAYMVPWIGLVLDYREKYTSQVQTAILLSEREQRLRAIVDNTSDGLITMDQFGIIQDFNPAAELIFGYSSREAIGENIKMLMPEPYRSEHDGYLEKYRNTGKKKIIGSKGREVIGKKKDGVEFPLEVSVSEMIMDDYKLYSGTLRDITKRKQSEDEIIRSNMELERFAYVASHDLQEPLRMINNFTALLNKQYADQLDDTAKQYIKFASSSAVRMQALVEDLLEYARISDNDEQTEQIDLNETLEVIKQNLADAIERTGASITSEKLPTLAGNPIRVMRLIQNIISNSIKYTTSEPIIHISVTMRGNAWIFCLQDNGIGMRQEYCEQIFEPFKRLHGKEQFSGTGMGLAICRKIVEDFEGKIWAESIEGSGSKFYFTHPVQRAHSNIDYEKIA